MSGYLVAAQSDGHTHSSREARRALGDMGAFQGSLNPLSARSIYESCVLSILLYGSETWLLDSTTIAMLDRFQIEIGRRILWLPSFVLNSVVRLCLCWPSMTSRILIRKLTYLAKLLSSNKRSISSDIFSSAIISDPLNVSLIQQCIMLESENGIDVLRLCLECPEAATAHVKLAKPEIINTDLTNLASSISPSSSTYLVCCVSKEVSWLKLWDLALDRGVHGTKLLQSLLFHLCRPVYKGFTCPMCSMTIDSRWFSHLCSSHPLHLRNGTVILEDDVISVLSTGNETIFNILLPS